MATCYDDVFTTFHADIPDGKWSLQETLLLCVGLGARVQVSGQKLWRFRGIYHSVLNDCAILCSIFPCDQILWRGASVCGCGYLIAAGHYTTIGMASRKIALNPWRSVALLLLMFFLLVLSLQGFDVLLC